MARCTRRSFVRGIGATSRAAASGGAGLSLSRVLAQEGDDAGGLLTDVTGCEISAKPLRGFDKGNPARVDFGRLAYRGGLELASPFKPFGGFSGLAIEPDGSGILSVSDVGTWLSARITYDGTAPAALDEARMGPLLDAAGKPLDGKSQQDAEAITLIEGSLAEGTVLVGFERAHRIVPYGVRGRQLIAPAGSPLKLPSEVREFAENASFEAVTSLRGGPRKGAVLAFAERYTPEAGYHTGWMWIDGEPVRLYLRDIEGFDVTDAASLDTGELLVLERRYRRREGVQMRLRLLAAADIAPNARLAGEILLQGTGEAFEIDNMEGIAVSQDAAGKTVLTLISDDNFNHKNQRTLLLQFTLLASAS